MTGSICDAIITPQPGNITFPILQRLAGAGIVVTDEEALRAMALAFVRLKIVARARRARGGTCRSTRSRLAISWKKTTSDRRHLGAATLDARGSSLTAGTFFAWHRGRRPLDFADMGDPLPIALPGANRGKRGKHAALF